MRTVREFKIHFKQQTGFTLSVSSEPKHKEFWEKLNRLGWSKKTKEPHECHDVDATAFLTDQEWEELEAEFRGS